MPFFNFSFASSKIKKCFQKHGSALQVSFFGAREIDAFVCFFVLQILKVIVSQNAVIFKCFCYVWVRMICLNQFDFVFGTLPTVCSIKSQSKPFFSRQVGAFVQLFVLRLI